MATGVWVGVVVFCLHALVVSHRVCEVVMGHGEQLLHFPFVVIEGDILVVVVVVRVRRPFFFPVIGSLFVV